MLAKEIRQKAWDAIVPYWKKVVLISLVVIAATGLINYLVTLMGNTSSILLSIVGVAISIVLMPLSYSVYWICLKLLRKNEIDIREITAPYEDGFTFLKCVGVSIVTSIFVFLWTLLLVVPGIMKAFSYALVPFIVRDNPDLGILDTITLSRKMMDGYKWKLFCLNFSFIGWWLLCAITFGILSIWVTPYILTANSVFYQNVKKDYDNKYASEAV